MKRIVLLSALLLCTALPVLASPLFSGADSADHDVMSVKAFAIDGTKASVMLIQSRAIGSHDYVVLLRSMAAESAKELIAEVRFKDGQEEGEPYAVWMDACFVVDGSICNERPGQRQELTLKTLLRKIETIMRRQRT